MKEIQVTKNRQEIVVEDEEEEVQTDSEPKMLPPPVREVHVKLLSAEDLQQFLLRRGAVDRAQLNLTMIIGGYEVWARDLRERYSLEGPFEVDPRTGQIMDLSGE